MKSRIKKIRRELEMTQQEFADKLGVKRNNIAGYETGSRSPSDAVISLICKQFDINEEWLRTGVGEMFIPLTKDKQISTFINNALKDEPASFRRRLISSLMLLKEDDWVKLGEIVDNLQIEILDQDEEPQPTSQKPLEEMSLEELAVEREKAEAEYIKSVSNSAKKTTSAVLNTTVDTQSLKNKDTNNKVSNQ